MFRLFRHARDAALANRKLLRFLRYSLGELFLVVAGILIALQIDDWNEDRKKVLRETRILIDIKADIQANIENLEEGIRLLEKLRANTLNVIRHYEQRIGFNASVASSLEYFLGWWDPDFRQASFENLKSEGVNIISNHSLRKEIINLFDVEMDILDVSEVNRLNGLFENMLIPIQRRHFYRDHTSREETWPFRPTDYERMMRDPEFYSVCTEYAYRQTRSIERFKAFNEASRQLIARIDAELAERGAQGHVQLERAGAVSP